MRALNVRRLHCEIQIVVSKQSLQFGEGWRGLERVGEGWRGLERVGEGWRGLERVGEGWRGLERVGEGWRGLERVGEGWRGLERVGEGWRGLETAHHLTTAFTTLCRRPSSSYGGPSSLSPVLEHINDGLPPPQAV